MNGTPFGRYRLIELLGRGGMGEVWRARDRFIQREVALKVLPAIYADDPQYRERFRREAVKAASLNEPHIVPIFDVGEVEGRLFVTMPVIEGRDLQAVLDKGPLRPERAVAIIEQVAAALTAAHKAGLVHRDVKPHNILLGEDDFAYLIDFGIARAEGETGLTSTGLTIGTWSYMAPERFSTGTIDASSDTYALTCVLYQCLTGELPFPGSTLEQIALAHLITPPPKPSDRASGRCTTAMDEVIATGMAKDPRNRYTTTKHFSAAARLALTTNRQFSASTPNIPKPPMDSANDLLTHAGPTVSASDAPTLKADSKDQDPQTEAAGTPCSAGSSKLSWRWGKWLYRPTQEVVDNDDPRVPKTVAESKKQRRTWLPIEIQGYGNGGYYWRKMDMSTSRAAQPTFIATWHPHTGPTVELARANDRAAYYACVRHHQATCTL